MSLAIAILLNILIFSAATFGTSLLIEKYYHGRLKWVLVPTFTLSSAILIIKTDFMLRVLFSVTKNITLHDLEFILVGGVVSGIFFSFL
jgi:hypothetical protein